MINWCPSLLPTHCRHMCMVMRGVQKINAKTVTSAMLGGFRDDSKTREEFLTFVRTP
jgi:GTP cyclohydrolase I